MINKLPNSLSNFFLYLTVRIRYQVLDESTQPRNPAELTITIEDASGVLIHSWNVGYLQRKQDTEIKSGNQGTYNCLLYSGV